MMPNITKGDRMDSLIRYLVGPGRRNEHENPHLVNGSPSIMAWFDDAVLSEPDVLPLAHELDHPRQVYDPRFHDGKHVWHCSLSVKAEEGRLGDERWAEIAEDFMRRMGFLDEGKAPVRWAAIHHGLTTSGNDHVHLAVDLVREDGTKASTWNDQPRAQKACRDIEQEFGLQVVEGRGIGMGERGRKPKAWNEAQQTGAKETYEERLERITRAVASTSMTEAEFVRGMRSTGLILRPYFASGGQDVVTGWAVATRPPRGQKPQWRAGGKLARDLTLPALRDAHWPVNLDDPVQAAKNAAEAAQAWREAKRNRPVRRPQLPELDPETQRRHMREAAELRESLLGVRPGDVGTWSAVAHHLSGTFAAWSWAAEGERPGPLAATAATLSRTAQVHRDTWNQQAHDAWGPTMRGLSLIVASAARGGRGPIGLAVLLRQLANMAKALHDAHAAAQRAQEAQRIAGAVLGDLEQVRQALPPAELRQRADERAAEAEQLVGGGRPRELGSPVPAHLQVHRQTQRTGGHDHGR